MKLLLSEIQNDFEWCFDHPGKPRTVEIDHSDSFVRFDLKTYVKVVVDREATQLEPEESHYEGMFFIDNLESFDQDGNPTETSFREVYSAVKECFEEKYGL